MSPFLEPLVTLHALISFPSTAFSACKIPSGVSGSFDLFSSLSPASFPFFPRW